MQFTCDGSQLNFYTAGLPIHRFSLNLHPRVQVPFNSTFTLLPNHAFLETGPLTSCSSIVGIPFYYNHVRDFPFQSNRHENGCVTRLMGVAAATHSEDHVALIAECTLEHRAHICGHQPRRILSSRCTIWNALADLEGFKLDAFDAGHSSLGNVMAVSPRGTRVALSHWAQLRVWALVPDAMHEEGLELFFPTEDFCQETMTGIIRHVELSSQGVIHSMCWHSEDHLYAMTDRGLVRWDVGPMACGRPASVSSDFEF